MKKYFLLTILSTLLTIYCAYLLFFGWDQLQVRLNAYDFQNIVSHRRFPAVLMGTGKQSWRELHSEGNVQFFRQIVARDPLCMDAWLKLAQAEIDNGNEKRARSIAAFCDTRISRVIKWKLSLTRLVNNLGMTSIFKKHINHLVQHQPRRSDIFQLLDFHTQFKAKQALSLLLPNNRDDYLKWLILENRTDAAHETWEVISASGDISVELLQDYVEFLLSQNNVEQAALLWRPHTSTQGMTNAGFENEILGNGFGWRIENTAGSKSKWQWNRVYGFRELEGRVLRIIFHGKENLDWHHLYQIVPVTPGQTYQLNYWWKTKGITTDQGPFVEITSFIGGHLYENGPMAIGNQDWTEVSVTFTPPANCHAVIVRFRRRSSQRFDNKIKGELMLDSFSVDKIDPIDSIGTVGFSN